MYTSEKNIDVLFLGSSHCMRIFDCEIGDKLLQYNTFNGGTSSQFLDGSYAMLVEAGKNNTLKEVWVELYYGQLGRLNKERTEMTATYILSDYMPFSFNKLRYLLLASSSEYYVNSFMPIRRTCENIFEEGYTKSLVNKKQEESYKNYDYVDSYLGKGFIGSDSYIESGTYMRLNDFWPVAHLTEDDKENLQNIIGYCEKNRIELHFFSAPMSDFRLVSLNNYDDYVTEISEYLKKLQQSGNLLLSIINNVLDMARIESGRMEIDENYARIEDIRQTLFEIFDDEAKKKNLAFRYTINVEHEHILTDTTKVKEIFVNILSNAIKYTPSGGSVMINIDELPCSGPGYMIVRTRVSDTGIGMSQEYLTNIFEAFTRERNTTKSKIAGTGLGMSIVKKYVELLGGTIDVESELGKGSTFTVTLKHKIADENYYVKNYAENPETYSEILKDRKILLAEDNDLNAEIAEAILERAGLKTERVEDGIQCVNKIEKMPAGTYDMILMDIQMPKMNGYKATQAIRRLPDKDKAYIPIVAMTANAFEEDKRDAIAAGMNGHIAKPIQVDKMLSILSEVIRQRENY